MSVPLIDLSEQHAKLRADLTATFEQVLDSGQFILGKYVERFESDLAGHLGAEHAIGMSSGTDALLAALMAMDIGPGDEVITTPFTFFATAGAITRVGAKPVFVDISPRTFNMDPAGLDAAITPATRAVIPVHLFGLPADMTQIMRIAREHGLRVIEDAAQSLGARHQGQAAGTIGDVGCLSFYPTKTLPALGEAGACVTGDAELARRLRSIRVHGAEGGYNFPRVGGNFRIDALQAALLSVKLPYLDGWIERRRELAERYAQQLEHAPISTPFESESQYHVYNQYTVRIRSGQRGALQEHLNASGVGSRIYYPLPLHLQPCFAELGYRHGRLPYAEQAANEVMSLPIYPEMSYAQQDTVIAKLEEFFQAE